jgi:hypothetical protein
MMKLATLFRSRACRAALIVIAAAAVAVPVSLAVGDAKPHQITFQLFPNTQFAACLANGTPKVQVVVTRGKLRDTMKVNLSQFKPGLDFDLFTVENSPQNADGSHNGNFTNFGLAWYQSDIHVRSDGTGKTTINTILLDQIFGFDPAVGLAPTNTFHVGFWFNNPADAAPCGFTGSTPFNGEHNAGPNAFISRPDPVTNLGPLCTDPNNSPPPACNP